MDPVSYDFSSDYGYTPSGSGDINAPVDGWSPSAVSPGATSWDDVLKNGISRTIDAVTRTPQLNNTAPVLQKPGVQNYAAAGSAPAGASAFGMSTPVLIGIVIAALAGTALYFALK